MNNELFFVPIILFAAFGASIWNGILKGSGDRLVFATLMVIPQVVVSGIFIYFLPGLDTKTSLILLLSALFHDAYIIFLGWAYRESELSYVFPIAAGSSPLFALVYWNLIQNVPISMGKIIGVLLLSLGIIGLPFTARHHLSKKSIILALITAALIASYAITDTYGLRSTSNVGGYVAWLFFIKGLILLIGMNALHRLTLKDIKGQFRTYMLAGSLAAFSYSIALWAFIYLHTAVVLALRSTSIMFSVAIGIIALKESFSGMKIILCSIIATGVFMILVF